MVCVEPDNNCVHALLQPTRMADASKEKICTFVVVLQNPFLCELLGH